MQKMGTMDRWDTQDTEGTEPYRNKGRVIPKGVHEARLGLIGISP